MRHLASPGDRPERKHQITGIRSGPAAMNPVVEELLQIAESDPLPAMHTSSHWQRYGGDTLVERSDGGMAVRRSWFGIMSTPGPIWSAAHLIERTTYSRVTSRLQSYRSVWSTAKHLARDLQFDLTFDVWRQAVSLAVLADHWSAHNLSPKTFALIGDGYGFLGALIHRYLPQSRIYCIDLPKILVFQARTHAEADPNAAMSVISGNGNKTSVNFVPSEALELISDGIDCAVNIASMQEMNQYSIASYFSFLRRRSTQSSRFYCVNRLQKELPGGEVTSFQHYPWQEGDEAFIDGPCPYYTHFVGLRTLPRGPKALGMRIPCVNYLDGVVMHRLAHLAPIPS